MHKLKHEWKSHGSSGEEGKNGGGRGGDFRRWRDGYRSPGAATPPATPFLISWVYSWEIYLFLGIFTPYKKDDGCRFVVLARISLDEEAKVIEIFTEASFATAFAMVFISLSFACLEDLFDR